MPSQFSNPHLSIFGTLFAPCHLNFQTRISASLARFLHHAISIFKPASQHLWHAFCTMPSQFSNPHLSIFGTIFAQPPSLVSNPHPSIFGTLFAPRHLNFQTRIPASLARFLHHAISIFKPASQHQSHYYRLSVALFAKHITHASS